ncbi:hypothetical protein KOI35_27645 [Actinoplanes bogorensis]|uniref:Uncharacterized protein n=1 Tax=Paractinoplanes bogorensis TaxID=1610840 RepID=A0ABS5YYV2_9ACTN|nr:hypothetical protein [Actinoplanes bogorensis]MBU2667290.1 hypothetical protein [Actinoplanes bogorensis]
MSVAPNERAPIAWAWPAVFGLLTLVVFGGAAAGLKWQWDRWTRPTAASVADCRLAQQLIDEAQAAPSGPADAARWEKGIRQTRYERLADAGISTEVGRYVSWQVVRATGQGERPSAHQFQVMTGNAAGHCDRSGVDLHIPPIAFP